MRSLSLSIALSCSRSVSRLMHHAHLPLQDIFNNSPWQCVIIKPTCLSQSAGFLSQPAQHLPHRRTRDCFSFVVSLYGHTELWRCKWQQPPLGNNTGEKKQPHNCAFSDTCEVSGAGSAHRSEIKKNTVRMKRSRWKLERDSSSNRAPWTRPAKQAKARHEQEWLYCTVLILSKLNPYCIQTRSRGLRVLLKL